MIMAKYKSQETNLFTVYCDTPVRFAVFILQKSFEKLNRTKTTQIGGRERRKTLNCKSEQKRERKKTYRKSGERTVTF